MIEQEISEKILTIGPYRKDGKGGIAVVLNNLAPYYNPFYFVASTRGKNPIVMGWYFGTAIFKLLYYILIKRIKVVHIHGSSYGSFFRKMILINIAYLFGIKIIYHIHSGGFIDFHTKYNKYKIIDKTINKANRLVVLTDSWKRFFSDITDSNKITVISNIVNRPASVSVENRLEEKDSLKILFLGMISENKGIYDLLDVIRLNKHVWDGRLKLYIGGNGNTAQLEEALDKEGLRSIVSFEGWVGGNEKACLLSSCDVFILPSYYEGLPVSILEAMSYGMPVISTLVGGIGEVIRDGENGFLIQPGDKIAIADKIDYFIKNRDAIRLMGERNLAIIEDFYPEAVIPELEDIYKKLLVEENK